MELHLVERFADRELAEATARQMTTCGPKRVERMTFFTRLSCLLKRGLQLSALLCRVLPVPGGLVSDVERQVRQRSVRRNASSTAALRYLPGPCWILWTPDLCTF